MAVCVFMSSRCHLILMSFIVWAQELLPQATTVPSALNTKEKSSAPEMAATFVRLHGVGEFTANMPLCAPGRQ
jgi:hypothetical protein